MTNLIKRAIMPTVISLALCIVIFYLLHPSGPVSSKFSIDLSFLIPTLIGFIVLLLIARLANMFLPGFTGKALSYIFTGAAFVLAFSMLLGDAHRLSEVNALASYQQYISKFSEIRIYVALAIIGSTIYRIAPLFKEKARLRRAEHATTALGLLLIGLAIWNIFRPFAQLASPLKGVGIIILGGFTVAALATLLTYGQKSRNFFVADACAWAAKSQLRNFMLGVLFGCYFFFIRPEIVKHFRYAPLIEWALVCLVVWRIYSGARAKLEEQHSAPLILSAWEKHSQEMERRVDGSFVRVSSIQEEFVEWGFRSHLLIYLTLLLDEDNWSQDQICDSLDLLISYRDEKIPWFAFRWEQKRIQKRNRKARKDLLDAIMVAVVQPQELPETVEVKL